MANRREDRQDRCRVEEGLEEIDTVSDDRSEFRERGSRLHADEDGYVVDRRIDTAVDRRSTRDRWRIEC